MGATRSQGKMELLAVVAANINWHDVITATAGRTVLLFVDNAPLRFGVINGNSPSRSSAWLLPCGPKPIRTISRVFELISRFEFDFRRCGNYFFERSEILVFKVQSHTMWLYMCMCRGMFVPTQLLFMMTCTKICIYL